MFIISISDWNLSLFHYKTWNTKHKPFPNISIPPQSWVLSHNQSGESQGAIIDLIFGWRLEMADRVLRGGERCELTKYPVCVCVCVVLSNDGLVNMSTRQVTILQQHLGNYKMDILISRILTNRIFSSTVIYIFVFTLKDWVWKVASNDCHEGFSKQYYNFNL